MTIKLWLISECGFELPNSWDYKGTSLLEKVYISLKDPTQQRWVSWKCCFSPQRVYPCTGPCGLAQATAPCLGREHPSDRVKAWGAQQYVVRQEICSFLKKTSGPSDLEGNTFFMPICNLCQPADAMYQDFENPEHGKFRLGGKGPHVFLFQHQGHLKI